MILNSIELKIRLFLWIHINKTFKTRYQDKSFGKNTAQK